MFLEADPLVFAKFHSLPVSKARSILGAETHPPWLFWRAFRFGYVRLKFNCIGAGSGNCIDEGMRHAEASIMRLCNLADHEAALTVADFVSANLELLTHHAHLPRQAMVLRNRESIFPPTLEKKPRSVVGVTIFTPLRRDPTWILSIKSAFEHANVSSSLISASSPATSSSSDR